MLKEAAIEGKSGVAHGVLNFLNPYKIFNYQNCRFFFMPLSLYGIALVADETQACHSKLSSC